MNVGAQWFFVDGRPATQGSKKAVAVGVLRDSCKTLKPWRRKVALEARAAGWMGEGLAVPFAVGLLFVRRRAKAHVQPDGRFRAEAPAMPFTVPDMDKLIRAVLDALTGVVWDDDCRVCAMRTIKLYGDREGLGVFVRPLELAAGSMELRTAEIGSTESIRRALSWWPTEEA